eukprot:3783367-Amphidinium_carterae.1
MLPQTRTNCARIKCWQKRERVQQTWLMPIAGLCDFDYKSVLDPMFLLELKSYAWGNVHRIELAIKFQRLL